MRGNANVLVVVIAMLVVVVGYFAKHADAHGYMNMPKSRNRLANERSWPEDVNYCPHCLNADGRRTSLYTYPETINGARGHGLCGDAPRGGNACWDGSGECPEQAHMPGGKFFTRDANGGLGGRVVATYIEGGIVDAEFVITAHHRGIISLRLCDEEAVTEECLQKYPPLERVRYEDEQLILAQPINPAYPELFYLNPKCSIGTDPSLGGAYRMRAKFRLPAGITCDACVLQMWWTTANSCVPPGFRDFDEVNPGSGNPYLDCAGDGGAGFYSQYGSDCESTTQAEEFWNCADIKVTASGGPGQPPIPETPPDGEEPIVAPPTPPEEPVEPPVSPTPPPPPQEEDEEEEEEDIVPPGDPPLICASTCTHVLTSRWDTGLVAQMTGSASMTTSIRYSSASRSTNFSLDDIWNANLVSIEHDDADGTILVTVEPTYQSFGYKMSVQGAHDVAMRGMFQGGSCCSSECCGTVKPSPDDGESPPPIEEEECQESVTEWDMDQCISCAGKDTDGNLRTRRRSLVGGGGGNKKGGKLTPRRAGPFPQMPQIQSTSTHEQSIIVQSNSRHCIVADGPRKARRRTIRNVDGSCSFILETRKCDC